MSKKRNKVKASGSAHAIQKKLDKIEALWSDDPMSALEDVAELAAKNPKNEEVWDLYAQIATSQNLVLSAFYPSYKLLQLDEENDDYIHNFALICGSLGMAFSAMYYAQLYHERIGDSTINRLDNVIEIFDPLIAQLYEANPHIVSVDWRYMALLEISEKLMSATHYQDARELCERLMIDLPDNPAPRNNLGLMNMLEGDYGTALAMQQQTLDLFPDNYHARCDLAQLLARLGRDQEAERVYAPMRQSESEQVMVWVKRCETLATMGKDAELIALYQEAEAQKIELAPFGLHLIATAYARQGEIKQAKSIWRKGKQNNPELDIVKDNLVNLDLPMGDTQDAWYFPFVNWVPDQWAQQVEDCILGRNPKACVEKLLDSVMGLRAVLPILLDRGDLDGREFALDILNLCPSPIVVDFMNSDKGTESNRVRAAYIAYKNNFVPHDAPIQMKIHGIVQKLDLFEFDVFNEPVESKVSKHIQKLINKSHKLIEENDYETALNIVEYARSMEPDERTLMNYHAMALIALQRENEARQIILETLEKHPDYLFPQMELARGLIREHKYDEAQQYIDKWRQPRRMHASEFVIFAVANIELLIEQKKFAQAKSWLYQTEQLAPYARPQLEKLHGMIAFASMPGGAINALLGAFGRGAN